MPRLTNKIFAFLAIPFFCGFALAQEPGIPSPYRLTAATPWYPIQGGWKFLPHDDIAYRDGFPNGAAALDLSPDLPWQLQSPETADFHGTGWFENRFEIAGDFAGRHVGLWLPVSFGGVQVYVNGKYAYENRSFTTGENGKRGGKPIVIEIPATAIRQGSNRINLRVTAFGGWSGFGSSLQIGDFARVQENWQLLLIKSVGIGFTCLFLCIFFLFHFLFRKREIYNLFFSGFCLSTALFVLGYYGILYYLVDQPWAYWLCTFLGGINMYMMPVVFIFSFFGKRQTPISKILTGFFLFLSLFVIVEFAATGKLFIFCTYLYLPFTLSYIPVVLYIIAISVKAVIKRLDFSKTILIGTGLLAMTFLYSMLVFAMIIKSEPLMGEGFFFMAVTFAIVLAKRFAQTHTNLETTHHNLQIESEKNVELNRTLEEKVKERTSELAEKNATIMDSITYAGMIQDSMLPDDSRMKDSFRDHFVIWRPRDVVGGDFYWFSRMEGGFLLALMDCTGHGIPGALLSVTAASTLDGIVARGGKRDPSEILGELNLTLKKLLYQERQEETSDDGLEIGICAWDSSARKLTFSGSRLALQAIGPDGIKVFPGDRQSIGYRRSPDGFRFTNHEITTDDEVAYVMTTDGFIDQNGGGSGYSFGKTRFRQVLEALPARDMETVRRELERSLAEFQGAEPQRDDITVLGFRVSHG